MRPKPWWTLNGDERAKAKAADANRHNFDDAGIRKYARLCKKFGVRYDDRISAKLANDKLILSNRVSSFALSLSLCDKAYFTSVANTLNELLPARNSKPSTSNDRSASDPA